MKTDENSNSIPKETLSKRKRNEGVEFVNRKFNYKECIICFNLVLNLSDHVQRFHKVKKSDPRYDNYVRDPPVIPLCYTKLEFGRRK